MKLPKSLLSAILIGVAVQTTSCTKEICEKKEKKEAKKKPKRKHIVVLRAEWGDPA